MASIRSLPNGTYKVTWRENVRDDYGAPIKGRYVQRAETCADYKAAERRKVAIEMAAEIGQSAADTRSAAIRTLGDYARDYFASLRGIISQRTLDGYIALYRVHIKDSLGNRPVGSIRVADIKALRAELLSSKAIGRKTTRSAKTTAQVLGVVRRILDTAVENGAIGSNPAAIVKARGSSAKVSAQASQQIQPREQTTPPHGTCLAVADKPAHFRPLPLTPAQVAQVADWIARVQSSPVYALAFVFSAYTGVRAAELAGLEIGDLTLSAHTGTVGAVSVSRTKAKRSGKFLTDTPKSAKSIRTIPIDSWLADDLRTYLASHPRANDPSAPLFPGRLDLAAAKALGRDVKDSADRFDWSKPVDPNNVYKRFMRPALAALKLPASRWHDLRHTFAVMSLSNGEHYMQVSKWLGHSTFTLTLDTYGDYISSAEGGKAAPLARPVANPAATNVVSLDAKRSS
ncbi:tyrosine-type recombinase/integrase [Mycobacterium sp. ML4]